MGKHKTNIGQTWPGEQVPVPGRHNDSSSQRWAIMAASVASFMVALDALVVTTALARIRADLHATLGQLEWTVNAYALSFAALTMTAAALGDRYGRRRLFCTGLFIFGAASAGCAMAPNIGWLIAGRAVEGVGAGMVMPSALAILSAAVPAAKRASAIGVFSSVTGFAVLCGPFVGGLIVQAVSWAWIFWLNIPISVVLAALTLGRVAESHGAAEPLDGRGVLLMSGATFAFAWGLVQASSAGWGSSVVLGSLVVGAIFAAAFVAWERRAAHPMVPMTLFRSRGFSAGNCAIFLWQASVIGTLFFMAQFFQDALGYGPLSTGLRLMPWGLTTFLVPQFAGRFVNRLGSRPFVVVGMGVQAGCMAWLAAVASPNMSYWQVVAPLVLSGAGLAIAAPAVQAAVVSSVAPQSVGKASGTLNTLRQLGGMFGVAALAAAFAARGSYASSAVFVHGFVAAVTASGALALTGAVVSLALPGRRPASAVERPVARAVEIAPIVHLGPSARAVHNVLMSERNVGARG